MELCTDQLLNTEFAKLVCFVLCYSVVFLDDNLLLSFYNHSTVSAIHRQQLLYDNKIADLAVTMQAPYLYMLYLGLTFQVL